jgi:hypothetical protein
MSQESMENLGFTEENSIQTEQERKKELAMKFIKMNEEARKNVESYFKQQYQNQDKNDTNQD